jgi:hypothetical protein
MLFFNDYTVLPAMAMSVAGRESSGAFSGPNFCILPCFALMRRYNVNKVVKLHNKITVYLR